MRCAVPGGNAGVGGRASSVQSKAPGCSKLGLDGGALAVTGDVLGIFPEIVELQPEVLTLGTFLWPRNLCVCVGGGLSKEKKNENCRQINFHVY